MTTRRSPPRPFPHGSPPPRQRTTFLINWALARRGGWDLLLRVEDLDGPRVKTGDRRGEIGLLAWLGLDHDGPVMHQSYDLEPYRHAMRTLGDRGFVFACSLSRSQIDAAATAPHAGDHEIRFPSRASARRARAASDSRPRTRTTGSSCRTRRSRSTTGSRAASIPIPTARSATSSSGRGGASRRTSSPWSWTMPARA